MEGKWLCLEIGAVATNCTVYLNGTVVARHHGGYAPFLADVTPVATFGQDVNTLAVHVDAAAFEGWWYEGAGIYRHAWLVSTGRVHVERWGVFVTTPVVSAGSAVVRVETAVLNETGAAVRAEVRTVIVDPRGRRVAAASSGAEVPPAGRAVVVQRSMCE